MRMNEERTKRNTQATVTNTMGPSSSDGDCPLSQSHPTQFCISGYIWKGIPLLSTPFYLLLYPVLLLSPFPTPFYKTQPTFGITNWTLRI